MMYTVVYVAGHARCGWSVCLTEAGRSRC